MEAYQYDIAISYASEQELFVKRVVNILEAENLKVFFAPQSKHEFLDQNMVKQFYRIYRYECKFVAAFVSPEYLVKNYCIQEANTALLREPYHGFNRLIPIYIKGAKLEDLDSDIHYIVSDEKNYVSVADDLVQIVKRSETKRTTENKEIKFVNPEDSENTNSIQKNIIVHGDVHGDIFQD